MIISRTPFRISFFGGGTDYPVWYKEHGGSVLATTIDKYCYLSCRVLPPFFKHKHRIVYSKIENVREVNEIEHPAVKTILRYLEIDEGLEIHHDGDLPARSGLGSSSSFTVGMLHTLYALKGIMSPKNNLASLAIHIEQDLIRENVGSQDQVLAAYGGFNRIDFTAENDFQVTPVIIEKERLRGLQSHLMLYFTGFSRFASEIAKEQIKNTPRKKRELHLMKQMVDEAGAILSNGTGLDEFGKLLHESWKLKRSLTDKIATSCINDIYREARRAGAVGGKLLGAGGGGFMLLFVEPEKQSRVREHLKDLLQVPFNFETQGSQIVVYQPDITPRVKKPPLHRHPVTVIHQEVPFIHPEQTPPVGGAPELLS